MSQVLQEASNFKLFSVRLTDTTGGGTAVPAPNSATFYLYDAITGDAIVTAGTATILASGDDYIIGYRASVAALTDVTHVNWQFRVVWTSPARVQWTPVTRAAVEANLA